MNYYTPDEGYQALTRLGNDGRNAYRLSNYTDFILPFLLFLSLSLPNLALGKGSRYIISPLIYMISDYIENIAEKYVLEIYPKRNDSIMMLACYSGLIKMIFATRTSNENLHSHHTNIKKTIQVLAQVLDKDNLSVLHYIAYYNNLYICRKLADENCDFNTVGNNGKTIINEDTQSLLIYLFIIKIIS
ncbi:unnamed protein product [Adineta steineri]|uniref:Uncharacterized protein n=1 Tax=Adineta steineri TaxID=433720 RepID=A0A813P9T5_9BILA|nr:unnamed protein product [Adineta steineri]